MVRLGLGDERCIHDFRVYLNLFNYIRSTRFHSLQDSVPLFPSQPKPWDIALGWIGKDASETNNTTETTQIQDIE
ncbi:unnamed protein product, partial [Rhizoctonia solani]